MSLEMRPMCERCGVALAPIDEAYICTFECTFCSSYYTRRWRQSAPIAVANWCGVHGLGPRATSLILRPNT